MEIDLLFDEHNRNKLSTFIISDGQIFCLYSISMLTDITRWYNMAWLWLYNIVIAKRLDKLL